MSNDWFSTRVLQGGGGNKNLTLEIVGCLNDMTTEPAEVYKFEGSRPVKIASAVWCIEEKAGLRLYWGKQRPILPMESRSSVRFDCAIPCPDQWDRTLILIPRKVTEQHLFSIILDFDQ